MNKHNSLVHHIHKRKRENVDSSIIKTVDILVYLAGFLMLFMSIPQVLAIWLNHDAGSVSLISWSAYLVGSFFGLLYGIIHKEKPIILVNLGWIFIDISIIVGIILYR